MDDADFKLNLLAIGTVLVVIIWSSFAFYQVFLKKNYNPFMVIFVFATLISLIFGLFIKICKVFFPKSLFTKKIESFFESLKGALSQL